MVIISSLLRLSRRAILVYWAVAVATLRRRADRTAGFQHQVCCVPSDQLECRYACIAPRNHLPSDKLPTSLSLVLELSQVHTFDNPSPKVQKHLTPKTFQLSFS